MTNILADAAMWKFELIMVMALMWAPLYFLPTIIGACRNHPDATAIGYWNALGVLIPALVGGGIVVSVLVWFAVFFRAITK